MKRDSTFAGRFALTGVAAAALCVAASSASALGLGRLQVQSALGEALRAEIDVTSMSPEEQSNLRLRVASPEAYRAAGVDYNSVLPGTQVELRRRPDGRPFLKITSDRGVQEPFIDVILEINWSSGRLVREYTMLFDPPTMARAAPPTPTTAAVAPAYPQQAAQAAPVSPSRAARALPADTPPAAVAPRLAERRQAPARPVVAEPPVAREPRPPRAAAAGADEYRVKAGDSLSRIAARTQRAGVSLDQMLVSLYRGNPQAFIDNNMNRLRSGVVLAVPAADAAKAVNTSEARQVIQAQSADFGAYRQRLASGLPAAKIEGSSRQASGKVQASVNDRRQGAAPAPDKLTLSKGAVTGKAAVEDSISKDRAKKADDVRVAELSKNLDDLKKLSGATAAAAPKTLPASSPEAPVRPAPTAPAVAASTPTKVAVQAPAPTAAPAAPVSPAVVPASVLAAPAPASASEPKPGPVLTAPAASTPVAAKAPASPAPAKPVAAPAEEPGVLGSLLGDNPTALGLGGLALALLAGFGIYRFSKRAKKDSGETSFLESRLQPDSFFGASGGQRIDTRDAGGASSSSMSYSLSQLDAIGDVDPVAEADVYLAYGRDLQAEEILKEAMRSTPERMAIRTKLLEVYAKRRDTKGFELLATQLFALTRGEGEDWAKAQEMGAQIDPENPLFQPGGAPVLMQSAGGQVIEPLGASTMPQSILPTPSQFGTSVLPTEPGNLGLDLDLDLGDPATGARSAAAPRDAPHVATPVATAAGPGAKAAAPDDSMSLDFSLPDLDEPTQPSPSRGVEPKPFDLADISFDIDMPDTQPGAPALTTARDASGHSSGFGDVDLPPLDGDADPLSRKLELAEEFRQIGDTDGARDLLLEVVAKSTGAVKTRAQNMLAALG